MKTITTLSVLVLLCVHTSAQFQLRYSTQNYDWPAALDIDLKDGYIIAGQTLSGTWYPSLLRVDANGTPIWSYTYNLPGIDEHFWDVTTAKWYPELLYVAVGNADMEPNASFDGDDYFLMVSAGGTPLYVKRYLTPDTDVAQHIQAIVHPNYGNGFVITGYTYHSQTKDKDIHILLTDKWGGLLKSAVLNTTLNQQAYCVEFTKDGGFIITGETQLEKTCDKKDVNVLVIRLDSQLKVLWSKTFDFIPEKGTSDDKAYAGREDSNGEIQLAGTSKIYINDVYDHDEPFLFHLKSDGTPVWLKSYTVETYPSAEVSSLITKTASDGSLINVLSGRTYQNFEALLFQTDYDGEPMWSRTYPASYSQSNTHAEDLVENEIKGYSFTGRMFNATAPSTGYDIHLVKTDVNGKTGTCEKEVRVISHKIRLCEDKLDYKITTMRELKISTDNVKLDLKIKKCDDLSAASSLEENTISPNPGESMITVSGYTKGTRIAIYDLQGVMKKKANFQHDNKIDISDLPEGVYVVEVTDANGLVHKQRFIKN